MTCFEGNIDVSSRIEEPELGIMKSVIQEIYNRINKQKEKQLQLLSDNISLRYNDVMTDKKNIRIKAQKQFNKNLIIEQIPLLSLEELVNGTLNIKLDSIDIKYECESLTDILKSIISKFPVYKTYDETTTDIKSKTLCLKIDEKHDIITYIIAYELRVTKSSWV